MTDFKIGAEELHNLGVAAAQDQRPKSEFCRELGVDPHALRKEAYEYAEFATGDRVKKAAKELAGAEPTQEDLVAAAVSVGFEIGVRAAVMLAGLAKGEENGKPPWGTPQ